MIPGLLDPVRDILDTLCTVSGKGVEAVRRPDLKSPAGSRASANPPLVEPIPDLFVTSAVTGRPFFFAWRSSASVRSSSTYSATVWE